MPYSNLQPSFGPVAERLSADTVRESVQGPPIRLLLPLKIVCIHGRIRSFKESGHQMVDFIPLPSHTHPFFIPIPNRPSHLPLSSYHPLYLYSTSPLSFFLAISHPLHLPFIYTSLFLSFLLIPPPFSPSSCVIRFPIVHSSFTPWCYSSRPPSSCSPGVCGSDNEARS